MTRGVLALDLDGTLLRADHTVSPRNRAAVNAAVAAGWHIVLATARWRQLAERTAADLGLVDPVIACSGAEVRRLRDGLDLYDVRLPGDFSADLYALCDELGAMAIVMQERDVLVPLRLAPAFPTPEVRGATSYVEAAAGDPRCVLVAGEEASARVLEVLQPRWRDEVRFLVSMTSDGRRVLTLTGAAADKGTALRIACADLGVDLADAVAMGDSDTDVEMFAVAGRSVAMGQASPGVQAAATWVSSAYDDDGVGRAIEEILAGERTAT